MLRHQLRAAQGGKCSWKRHLGKRKCRKPRLGGGRGEAPERGSPRRVQLSFGPAMGSKPSSCVGTAAAEGSPWRAAPRLLLSFPGAWQGCGCPVPARESGSLWIGTSQCSGWRGARSRDYLLLLPFPAVALGRLRGTGTVPEHSLSHGCPAKSSHSSTAWEEQPQNQETFSSRKPFPAGNAPVSPLAGRDPAGSRPGAAAPRTEVNQTRAQDWFPEFGFTSQYRNHLEPSGDTRSTGSVMPIPQRRLVHPRSHQGTENTSTSCLLCNLFSQFY